MSYKKKKQGKARKRHFPWTPYVYTPILTDQQTFTLTRSAQTMDAVYRTHQELYSIRMMDGREREREREREGGERERDDDDDGVGHVLKITMTMLFFSFRFYVKVVSDCFLIKGSAITLRDYFVYN